MKYYFNSFAIFLKVYFHIILFFKQVSKQYVGGSNSNNIPFYQKALIAGVSGAFGGFVGTPGDMINVRMQNDVKLPLDQRRKY